MRSNCWKHHCINQHQQGKIQTQTPKECKEKSNPVRANISSQLPPPRICRERKAEGTSQQYTFCLSAVICLVLLSFSIAFGGPGHNGGPLHIPSSSRRPWVPPRGWLCSDTNPGTAATGAPLLSPIRNLEDVHDSSEVTQAIQDRPGRKHGSPRGVTIAALALQRL